MRISLKLLEPYKIPEDCPYLSEDQRELSELPFEKRAEWMAEWLLMAQATNEAEDRREEMELNAERLPGHQDCQIPRDTAGCDTETRTTA